MAFPQIPTDLEPSLVLLWSSRILSLPEFRRVLLGPHGIEDSDVARLLYIDTSLCGAEKSSAAIAEYLDRLKQRLSAVDERSLYPEDLIHNIEQLGRALSFSALEKRILLFAVTAETNPDFQDLLKPGMRRMPHRLSLKIIASALQESESEVSKALSVDGVLISSGLLQGPGVSSYMDRVYNFKKPELAGILDSKNFNLEALLRSVVTPAPQARLHYADFPQLKGTLEILRPYLRKALREKQKGFNCFLFGPPGTGKTELVRMVAREMRATLYEIGCEDTDGDPNRGDMRMASVRIAHSLLARRRALLLFDEAEDIFRPGFFTNVGYAGASKGWMNRLFEQNPVPTFWISNSLQGLDPAFSRRFTFNIPMDIPSRKQRRRIYRKLTRGKLQTSTLEQLATADALSPAVVDNAFQVASAVEGHVNRKEELDNRMLTLINNTMKVQGMQDVQNGNLNSLSKGHFQLGFINSDPPLAELVASLTPKSQARLCLFGPPGTGKTSFGHWLGMQLGIPVHSRRASDILGPYVGQTEKQIAGLFREAQEEGALLQLDEVDSFLQERRSAHRSWEVTQVNELLVQMEQFEGLFIATTNLMDGLDTAAWRRFDLKIRLDYLSPEQIRRLWAFSVGMLGWVGAKPAVMEELCAVDNLTPGDFANVARQHQFRCFPDAAAFGTALLHECRLKKDRAGRTVGFA